MLVFSNHFHSGYRDGAQRVEKSVSTGRKISTLIKKGLTKPKMYEVAEEISKNVQIYGGRWLALMSWGRDKHQTSGWSRCSSLP